MNRPWSGDHERTIDIKPLPRRDASGGNRILPVAELLSERYFYLVWDFHQALFARGGVLIDQQSHFRDAPPRNFTPFAEVYVLKQNGMCTARMPCTSGVARP